MFLLQSVPKNTIPIMVLVWQVWLCHKIERPTKTLRGRIEDSIALVVAIARLPQLILPPSDTQPRTRRSPFSLPFASTGKLLSQDATPFTALYTSFQCPFHDGIGVTHWSTPGRKTPPTKNFGFPSPTPHYNARTTTRPCHFAGRSLRYRTTRT